MYRINLICIVSVLCLLMCMGSCTEQSSKQDKVVVSKSSTTNRIPDNIFYYTSRHRADKYEPTESKIAFSSHIQSINPEEFKDNTNIREVWISPRIQHIANGAFAGCTSLEKLHFQGEVKVINDDAFLGCSALKDLNVDVWTVGLDAFFECASLETVRFGEHIWWVRDGAFAYCPKLRSVLMAISMQKLDFGAFEGSKNIEEFSIPNDFKNYMFGYVPSAPMWKKIYLLSTEYYPMPKNCTPQKGCTLYVPDAFLSQFRADENWMQFGSIEPLSKSKYYTAEGFWK